MWKAKLVIVLLCLINLVELRKLYYPDRHDPNAIVFEGPTNFESRKASENEVDEDNIVGIADVRFGSGETDDSKAPPPSVPVNTGFVFPDD